MQIVYASEELKPEHLIVEIYGEPGVGKSSVGFTGNLPLTLDFDHGAHRSAYRKDIVKIGHWNDVATIPPEDLVDYQTVVVDTVGRALDMLTVALISGNPKLATAQGGLTMSGYGALKAQFTDWLKRLTTMGKDVVLLAHSREDRKADDTMFYRPDITGGSAGEIYKAADVIGFYHMRGGKRTIEFTPSDAWAGKDPANVGSQAIPDFAESPTWLGDLIDQTKAQLGGLSKESQEIATRVAAMIEKIGKAKTPAAINKVYNELRDADKVINQQCKGTLQYRTRDLGLVFDREAMKFAKPPKDKAAEEAPEKAAEEAETATAEAE